MEIEVYCLEHQVPYLKFNGDEAICKNCVDEVLETEEFPDLNSKIAVFDWLNTLTLTPSPNGMILAYTAFQNGNIHEFQQAMEIIRRSQKLISD